MKKDLLSMDDLHLEDITEFKPGKNKGLCQRACPARTEMAFFNFIFQDNFFIMLFLN